MRVTKLGKKENMARNLFNLKTLLPLDIQMLADGGEGTPPTENPPSGDDINGQESTLTLKSVQTFLNENAEGKSYLQSFADTRVTEAIKTYETKTLP